MLKIRKFKLGDENKLSYLTRRCIVSINSKDATKKQTDNLYNHFTPGHFVENAKRFTVYVAELNNKVVGTDSLDENWIRTVFVSPSLHGQGIGTALMDYLEDKAKKLGMKFINIKSSPFAVNFYKKRGYKKVKAIVSEVGPITLMKKKLD
jgi:GNAT superfamily N-acetyltransferase